MIGIKLEGRLGNQMFQLITGLLNAKRLNTKLFIYEYPYLCLIFKTFEMPQKGLSKWFIWQYILLHKYLPNFRFRYRIRALLLWITRKIFFSRYAEFGFEEPCNPNWFNLEDKTLIHGYFQSWIHTFENKNWIQTELFKFLPSVKQEAQQWINQLPEHTRLVTLHVRKTDLSHVSASDEFYHSLIQELRSPGTLFVMMSDDLPYCRKIWGNETDLIISDQNTSVDLFVMTQANIVITSNSTFSWWGAFLNIRPELIVYAPEYFMGVAEKKWIPFTIMPPDWIVRKV